ncbi:carbohydrate porin [Photobacterium rosenbergii]|uniref:carbohydrate porin n=1 Tax=Photobacterium rosenbergii TaxID=294936 RepID=UPI001C9A1661|nr:carbohydrate porin [Photobacterium rosenbergii]MBY5944709.1 carbohydrate porin [Photobacterium rosenbergii]
MNISKLKLCSALVLFSLSNSTLAESAIEVGDFNFHGYVKSGTLWNDQGMGSDSFRLTDMGRYRLGNENETKVDLSPDLMFNHSSGAWARTKVRFQSETRNTSDWAVDSSTFVTREAFAEIGGLPQLPDTMLFWAGKRYMKNRSSHILDWDYHQANGTGGGIWGIPLTNNILMDLDLVSWGKEGYTKDPIEGVGYADTLIFKPRLEFILSDKDSLKVEAFWMNLEHNPVKECDEGFTCNPDVADDGFAVTVAYDRAGGFMGLGDTGYTEFVVQYGTGMGAGTNMSKFGWGEANYKDQSSYRFTLSGISEFDNWAIQPVAIYHNDDDFTQAGGERVWWTVGARPSYHFNEFFSLQFEAGYEHLKQNNTTQETNNGANGGMTKLTIAPTLHLEKGYWARPQLRVFATYAKWDESLKNINTGKHGYSNYEPNQGFGPGGASYAGKTEGFNFGIQAEVWF